MSFFQKLPEELRIGVFELCEQDDLVRLCLTARHVRATCIEYLYRDVDLYSPDYGMPESWYRPHGLSRPNSERESNTLTYHRQLSLIRSLRQNPQHGAHVKKLRWTTTRPSDEVREKELDLANQRLSNNEITPEELKSIKHELDFFECNSTLWTTFSLFTNVRSVELSFSRNIMFREANAPPTHLFPLASSIWLSGITSRYVVNSILDTGNPHLLEHLHLDNLQEFAELDNIPQSIPRAAKARMRASQHHPDPDPDPDQTTPTPIAGPMRTHLTPFIGKWTHLRSLHISTASQSSDVDHSRLWSRVRTNHYWDPAAEDARYAELAALLRSVARTLRLFRFEHGPTGNLAADGWAMAPARRYMETWSRSPPSARPPPSRVRPMDARFVRFLIPAIVGSGWERLERMELVGVAARSRYDDERPVIPYEDCEYWPAMVNTPLDEGTQAALRRAVGEKAVLVLRESAEGWFWIAENGKHGHGIPEVAEGEDEGDDE